VVGAIHDSAPAKARSDVGKHGLDDGHVVGDAQLIGDSR